MLRIKGNNYDNIKYSAKEKYNTTSNTMELDGKL